MDLMERVSGGCGPVDAECGELLALLVGELFPPAAGVADPGAEPDRSVGCLLDVGSRYDDPPLPRGVLGERGDSPLERPAVPFPAGAAGEGYSVRGALVFRASG